MTGTPLAATRSWKDHAEALARIYDALQKHEPLDTSRALDDLACARNALLRGEHMDPNIRDGLSERRSGSRPVQGVSVLQAGCGCVYDPNVGRWVSHSRNCENFHTDGTGRICYANYRVVA